PTKPMGPHPRSRKPARGLRPPSEPPPEKLIAPAKPALESALTCASWNRQVDASIDARAQSRRSNAMTSGTSLRQAISCTRDRGIVFDFGGVLWDMRWDVARELDRRHGLPRSSVFETLYRSDAWSEIERGTGDPAAWRDAAHRALEARAGGPLPPLHEEWLTAQGTIGPNLEL